MTHTLKKLLMVLALCTTTFIYGYEKPRITELLPHFKYGRVPIDPALPENFVARCRPNTTLNDELDHEYLYDPLYYHLDAEFHLENSLFWGPEEVLENYFIDESSLDQPIISVKPYSLNASFTDEEGWSFTDTTDLNGGHLRTYFDKFIIARPDSPNNPVIIDNKAIVEDWSSDFFPVIVEHIRYPNQMKYRAFIASRSVGHYVIELEVIYPANQQYLNRSQLAIWHKFLYETQLLPWSDAFHVQFSGDLDWKSEDYQ